MIVAATGALVLASVALGHHDESSSTGLYTKSPSRGLALSSRQTAPKDGRCFDQNDATGAAPPPDSVTTVQKLEFGLIEHTAFNGVSGTEIVRDLLRSRPLWCAVYTDQAGPFFLTVLRDENLNIWNTDTFWILSSQADDAALVRLARKWHATGIEWVHETTAKTWLGGDPYPLARWRLLMLSWY
jgi:hypothetical protein